jgi:hypothetical protein
MGWARSVAAATEPFVLPAAEFAALGAETAALWSGFFTARAEALTAVTRFTHAF